MIKACEEGNVDEAIKLKTNSSTCELVKDDDVKSYQINTGDIFMLLPAYKLAKINKVDYKPSSSSKIEYDDNIN